MELGDRTKNAGPLCRICRTAPAVVHITQVVESSTSKIDLCEVCAKEKGLGEGTCVNLAELLTTLNTQVDGGNSTE